MTATDRLDAARVDVDAVLRYTALADTLLLRLHTETACAPTGNASTPTGPTNASTRSPPATSAP
jgi:hypothetical protein